MAQAKAPKSKLWLIVYLQLAVIVVGVGVYLFISQAQNSPEAVYSRAMKMIGAGLEEFASPEAINQASGGRYRGHLAISGFSRQDGQEALEQLGLWDPSDPASVACFGQLLETDNQLRLELDSNFDNPAEGKLLGSGQLEADLQINQSPIGSLEVRLVPGDEPGPIPPVYFMIDKTDCLEQLATDLPEDLLGTWWLVDLPMLLGEQLGDELSSLLQLTESTAETPAEDDNGITQADYDELVEIITGSLKTHVFTDDSEQMIMQMTESVDKQAEFDGQTGLYKYDVNLNSANTIAFLSELSQQIEASQLYQKAAQRAPNEPADEAGIDSLRQSIDQFNQENKIEVWINPKTKLLRNLRITTIDPTSLSLGSTLDFGLTISDDQEIVVDTKATILSAAHQCQSTKDGLELSRSDYDQQADCPYLLDPELEAVPAGNRCPAGDGWSDIIDPETVSRCLFSDGQGPVYTQSLKDNPQPYQIQSFKLTFGPDGQSFSISYQLSSPGNTEISFEIEAIAQQGEQPVIAPPDARPIEELEAAIGPDPTDLFASPRNNTRAADVNQVAAAVDQFIATRNATRIADVSQIAGGINQYIANRNALPTSWSEIEPLTYGLSVYQPDRINAAGAWADNSTAGEFIDLSAVGDLDQTQAAGGVKLASDDADAVDYLMVFRKAACNNANQSLVAGSIRQIAIVYKLEGQGTNCLEV